MLRMPTRCVTDCGQRPVPEEDVGVLWSLDVGVFWWMDSHHIRMWSCICRYVQFCFAYIVMGLQKEGFSFAKLDLKFLEATCQASAACQQTP